MTQETNIPTKFKTERSAKKWAKFYSLLQILWTTLEPAEGEEAIIKDYQNEWAFTELCRMNLPSGFSALRTKEKALVWFLKNVQK